MWICIVGEKTKADLSVVRQMLQICYANSVSILAGIEKGVAFMWK